MNEITNTTFNQNQKLDESSSGTLTAYSLSDFQSKYDVLVHTIPDGLVLLKDEKIKYSNKHFADLLGYKIPEITELGLREVIAPNDLEKVLERSKKRLFLYL